MKTIKKILVWIVVYAISIFGVSCDNNQCSHIWEDATCRNPRTCVLCYATEGEPLEHLWEPATCETPRRCSVCYERSGVALGHTTDVSICKNCGRNFGAWDHEYYVDKYDNPTNNKYIRNGIIGSSDDNSTVYINLFVNYRMDVFFEFSDYFEVSYFYPYDFCYTTTIFVLDENQKEHEFIVYTFKGFERIYFFDESYHRDEDSINAFFELMRSNETLQIHIRGWDYSYTFKLNTKGFKEAYEYLTE